jgi:hypothetical protein
VLVVMVLGVGLVVAMGLFGVLGSVLGVWA